MNNKLGWEKPDWAKNSPLKSKKGTVDTRTQSSPISPAEKNLGWEKPSWVKTKLKATGKDLRKGIDLQAPITHINREKERMDDINFEANPLILKPTEKGTAVRLGENLARPITFINSVPPSKESKIQE